MKKLNAKKIYQKHIDKNLSGEEWLSPKQIDSLTYEATINAINEVIDMMDESHSNKYVIYSTIKEEEVETEDSGMAKIFTAGGEEYHDDNGMFVRIQSWDENLKHTQFNRFIGKRVKVTIQEQKQFE